MLIYCLSGSFIASSFDFTRPPSLVRLWRMADFFRLAGAVFLTASFFFTALGLDTDAFFVFLFFVYL